MSKHDLEIIKLFKDGLSLNKIAKVLQIPYSTIRYCLIKNNAYKPKLKKNIGDKAVCIICQTEQPIKNFPLIYTNGYYMCYNCKSKKQLLTDLKKFNCTLDKYYELYQKQNGKCAICQTTIGHISAKGNNARLAIDHCHKTNKVRGLLCGNCNRGLGCLGEDNLHNAIKYLEHAG